MAVRLEHWTGTLWPAYLAGRTCVVRGDAKAIERPSEESMARYLREKIVAKGHWSILEHLTFTFLMTDISRLTINQQERHRIASYSQGTSRLPVKDMRLVIPHTAERSESATQRLIAFIEEMKRTYEALVLVDGIPYEDARYALGLGMVTQLVMTMNGRALIESGRKRLCQHAQWEIREAHEEIARIVREVCPLIGQQLHRPCAFGLCPEEDFACKYFQSSLNVAERKLWSVKHLYEAYQNSVKEASAHAES